MTAPAVSIIVCAFSHERWDLLVRAVDSLHAQPEDHEIILVIDNNPELYARARYQWPQSEHADLTIIENAGPRGLSHARNTGLAAVSGEIVAFLDDDAAARHGWQRELTAPFADPHVLAAGGVAIAEWPTVRPAALPAELDWVVGCSFTGQQRGQRVRNVMGCNMAFRSAPLREIGGFDTGLGRVGSLPLGAEETDACIRVQQRYPNGYVTFVERAIVDHRVTAERARFAYVVRRSFAEGISKAALSRRLGSDSLGTERSYTMRVLPRALGRELVRLRVVSAAAIVASVGAAGIGFIRGRAARVAAEDPLVEAVR